MSVSVLICTYNRPSLLKKALASLTDGVEERPDEIVVVNGGDKRTDRLVRRFADSREASSRASDGRRTQVKLIKTVNKNLAASRNVGLLHCTGDIIAMTDDDAEVFPDWVTQMKRLHAEHPEAGAVGGAVIGAHSQDSFLSRLADVVTFVSPSEPQYVRTLPGVNISYKRDAVEKVGPQDETLFRGEDVDYNWRVKQLGYEILYHPAVKVRHYHRPTLRHFLHQHYMYGRAYYLVRRKWQEMYCVYPHRLETLKDVLKAGHFFASVLYQPAVFAGRMERWVDRLRAYPVLMLNQLAWKGGMVHQMWLEQATG
jgi:GT2 family glycosyltransferase